MWIGLGILNVRVRLRNIYVLQEGQIQCPYIINYRWSVGRTQKLTSGWTRPEKEQFWYVFCGNVMWGVEETPRSYSGNIHSHNPPVKGAISDPGLGCYISVLWFSGSGRPPHKDLIFDKVGVRLHCQLRMFLIKPQLDSNFVLTFTFVFSISLPSRRSAHALVRFRPKNPMIKVEKEPCLGSKHLILLPRTRRRSSRHLV